MNFTVFCLFQIINGLTALGMFLAPRRFHESMFQNPAESYRVIGFSPTAVEMVHNVIRGQGAALLAISLYLQYQGSTLPGSYLLIALTCGLSLLAHVMTAYHHLKNEVVMSAIGSIHSMYVILTINLIVGGLGLFVFFRSV